MFNNFCAQVIEGVIIHVWRTQKGCIAYRIFFMSNNFVANQCGGNLF